MRVPLSVARWLLAGGLGLSLAVGLLAARSLRELRIQVNDLDFLPQNAPVLQVDEEVRRSFGSDERLIVAFEAAHRELFDPRFRADLSFFLGELSRSHNLNQLLFDRTFRPRFQPADVAGEPYLLHPPSAAWVEQALAKTAVTGKLAAGRSRRAVFLEFPALSASGVGSIQEHVERARQLLEGRSPGEYRVRVLGRHVVLNGLGQAIFKDLARILPWSFLAIGLLFWLLFRSWVLVGLTLFQSGLTVVVTLAAQARLGHPLSLMTAMIPVLITVIGIADEIHFFGTFLALRQAEPQRLAPSLAWETLRRMFVPCTAMTLTTVIGFATFWATDAPALQVFGLMAGISLAVSWLISLTLVPAVLALVPIRASGWGPRAERRSPRAGWWWHPALPLALSVLALPGLLRLRVDDGWTRNFAPGHPIVADVRWFEGESVGLYQMDLELASRDGLSFLAPERLQALARLEQAMAALPEVRASIGLVDLLRDRRWELGVPAGERPALPTEPLEVRRLLASYRLFNEDTFVRLVLSREERATRLFFALAGDDYRTAARVREALLAAAAREFSPGEVEAKVGGSAERGRVLIGSIVGNQLVSVAVSLGVSFLALAFAAGAWGRAARCILANAWALAVVLGAAGWLGVPLGVASSCFLALGVGIGLDYSIHLAFHHPGDTGEVVRRVLANVAIVASGIGLLMLSANPTIARLGLLLTTTLLVSAYLAIVSFGRRSALQHSLT